MYDRKKFCPAQNVTDVSFFCSACGSINDLVDVGEGEGILGASLIEVFEIDAQAPGFVLLWHHHQVCQPVRMFYFSNESDLDWLG